MAYEEEYMKTEINLLPISYIQAHKMKKRRIMVVISLIIGYCTFIGGGVLPTKLKLKAQSQQLEALQNQLEAPEYKGILEKLNALDKAQEALTLWEQTYEALKEENQVTTQTLDVLMAYVPEGIMINRLTMGKGEEITDGGIYIEGEARDTMSVLGYVTYLESIYPYDAIYFTSEEQMVQDIPLVAYTITITEREAYGERDGEQETLTQEVFSEEEFSEGEVLSEEVFVWE